ncbi:uncharacterized protein EV154DRAFT_585106 [Mucor mucedo]|uniref:uncharacterized protein n=1 Tax=Mucor mucedo TaxID=29922 RepID=UPI0022210DA6|nr:uncharacterized protein EV154DRAFT_585106 [Mucor mucedo]KAI7896878.1 hypothetical protein EV154DRAFT_585106 [Mucor mucedo]
MENVFRPTFLVPVLYTKKGCFGEIKKNGVEAIETGMSTTKTADVNTYSENRFFLNQGRQRADEAMVNILVHVTSKYNKRKGVKKKIKKRRKKKFKKRDAKVDMRTTTDKKQVTHLFFKKIFMLNCQSFCSERPNKWNPLPYEEDKSKVPLVVFGAGMFGKNLVKLKGLTVWCDWGLCGDH